MQLVGKPAHFPQTLLRQRRAFVDHFERAGVHPGRLAQHGEVHRQRRQILSGGIVQLARDLAPFFVVQHQNLSGKRGEPPPRILTREIHGKSDNASRMRVSRGAR